MHNPLTDTALAWAAAGASVIPIRTDGTKAPAVDWKRWQTERADPAQIAAWFGPTSPLGIGLVCGAISGQLEMLEAEAAAVEDGLMPTISTAMTDHGLDDVWTKVLTGYLERSPSGGLHVLYRIVDGPARPNTKLARRPDGRKVQVLVETRGEGGLTVIAPTAGHCHPTGRPWELLAGGPGTVPTITADERDRMFAVLSLLDQMPVTDPQPTEPTTVGQPASGRPGDDYNARASWDDILTPHGWTKAHRMRDGWAWVRPGKTATEGISATTGQADDADRLYVFSTSTEFESETPYSKFGALAVLEHGGDHAAAARALRKAGYGADTQPAAVPPVRQLQPRPGRRDRPTVDLAAVHRVFAKHLGDTYDLDALDIVLAAAAGEQLGGDPVWVLVISGSGNAKTETVQALNLVGDGDVRTHVTSSISSPGALLSATSRKEKTPDATGGLLRAVGPRGILVVKDVTSILSMSREMRGEVLAAFREIYDGRWSRSVGTDGGRTLEWEGRLVVVGAVTTAWDQAHEVIASMGDRFVLVRMDSTQHRLVAGRRAIANTGNEEVMRAELAEAVAGLLAGLDPAAAVDLTEAETERLLEAADLTTRARTAVIRDQRGDVIDAHAPEMPTRFAKQLAQIFRGAIAIGVDRSKALQLAIRCARDSLRPLRLDIIDDLALHPHSPVKDVRRRINKPRLTVDRELQALHMLGVLDVEEVEGEHRGQQVTHWHYSLTESVDADAINPNSVPEKSVDPPSPEKRDATTNTRVHTPTDISGTEPRCRICGRSGPLDAHGICPITDSTHARAGQPLGGAA
jgi:hypothetical protein